MFKTFQPIVFRLWPKTTDFYMILENFKKMKEGKKKEGRKKEGKKRKKNKTKQKNPLLKRKICVSVGPGP